MNRVEPEHGTRQRYQKGCKCDQCSQANAAYKAGLQASHKARTQAAAKAHYEAFGTVAIPTLTHGKASTRQWKGCPCAECESAAKEANRKYKRRYLARQLARLLATQ